jgi:biopolymer transport protein ExbD
MAISLNGGAGGSRRRGGAGSLSEINVTPFVDVVLVLLVIFILTAHVMEFGIEVDVPKVRAVRETAQELPVVTITKDGTLTLNGEATNIHDMNNAIHAKFTKATAAYVRADGQVTWETLAQVVAELGEGKIQVNMVTQPEDTAAKSRKQ